MSLSIPALAVPARARVLFIGDSVTEAGRRAADPGDLGAGWAAMAAGWFTLRRPRHGAVFVNRGVGGDRVRDLRARWRGDCLDLDPDVVTVLIGINDTWRRFDDDDPTGVVEFDRDYRAMLGELRDSSPTAGLLLAEPFVLPVDQAQRRWRADLDPKIATVRLLAAEFGAALLPLDGLMAQAAAVTGPRLWCPDGVHPSPAGHALIADAWLDAVLAATP